MNKSSILYFSGSVFCGAMNKTGTLAATGGEDDKAFVWETSTGQVILECNGHSDSVTFAEFNQDGTYLATADMGGVIQVWKMSNKLLIWDFNLGDMTVSYSTLAFNYSMLLKFFQMLKTRKKKILIHISNSLSLSLFFILFAVDEVAFGS